MKYLALAAVFCGGCSLYFGDDKTPPVAPPPGDTNPPPTNASSLPSSCGGEEVHVFGVYETRSDHSYDSHPTGDGDVTILRPGVHHIVLSAYEPTAWHLKVGPGVTLASVHLIGYSEQTVELLNTTDTPVITSDIEETGTGTVDCGFAFPNDDGGCDTPGLLARAKDLTGEDFTSFHGCYHATSWTLDEDGNASSDCAVDEGYQQYDVFGTCAGGGDDGGDHGGDCGGPTG